MDSCGAADGGHCSLVNVQAGLDGDVAASRRERVQIRGLVQGVGFRPHVYKTAQALGMAGWVKNDAQGVTLEVQGECIDEFVEELVEGLPSLARIDSLHRYALPLESHASGFVIEKSDLGAAGEESSAAIPADVAMCAACTFELFDSQDRRYLHPFIACSDCGPRFSITERLPYDRRNTTMSQHDMCESCATEYRDPLGRRLHAEPIACHDCGPRLSHSIDEIAAALESGLTVAIKGVGGFHLVCDARDTAAIKSLRDRKRRSAKPFAVMMLNAASAKIEISMSSAGEGELCSSRRPVVVAQRAQSATLPPVLAPGVSTLGVMLPYTAVHYLIFWTLAGRPQSATWLEECSPHALVMTSANISGDPILADDKLARAALADIADLVVTHDRGIVQRSDDSVIRDADGKLINLRRSRGYAPQTIRLKKRATASLGVGAHLKNTVCALRGSQAHFSQHLGDMHSVATREFGRHAAEVLLGQLNLEPKVIACDLHRDYASTRLAEDLATSLSVPLVRVQHHHAHAAAVLAAAGWTEPALALTLDGHGAGSDGSSWGGEILKLEAHNMERLGHLSTVPVPGGDRAAREPWRMAAACLAWKGRSADAQTRFAKERAAADVIALAMAPLCPQSSSAGRLFDAAASLLDICHYVSFEAEAAMRLEGSATDLQCISDGYTFDEQGNLDFSPLLLVLADESDASRGAGIFHGTLLAGLEDWILRQAEQEGLNSIALAGGCFANRWLASQLPVRLQQRGMQVFSAWDRLPPGDGGISLGQAHIASLRYANDLIN